jgi:signal peptidase I
VLALWIMRSEHPRRRDEESSGAGRRPGVSPGCSWWRRQLLEFLITSAVAFALVFGFIKPAVADSYRIPSASMEPTLHGCEGCDNDRVLANKFIYRFSEPERGQVVVFRSVEDDETLLIKRIVGAAGDEIRLRGGTLYVNGEQQKEPYLHANPCVRYMPKTCAFGPVKVPRGHVFVMGDNRANSHDSRFFGPVPGQNLEGEAFVRYWPPTRIGPL